MAELIRMPKMSDTMTEGVIAEWHKQVGDTIASGDILAEVETDKATMELESYEDGTLLYIGPGKGDAVPIDGVIAIIGEAGEDYNTLLSGESGGAQSAAPTEEVVAEPVQTAQAIDVSGIDAEVVRMPKMTDTMTEAVFVGWSKSVGDTVATGDVLAEVETDKATMELESYNDGTLLYIGVEAGNAIPIDGIIAIIGDKDADYKKLLEADAANTSAPVEKEVAAPATEAPAAQAAQAPKPSVASTTSSNGRVKISPLAKKLAEEKGYELTQISGSGPQGRIIKTDVEAFTPSASVSAGSGFSTPVGQESFEDIPLTQMRKVIARRLSESKFSAPHFYLTMEINMDNAIASRKSMNEVSPSKISFNDMIVKASAAALKQHPGVNSMWLDDSVRLNHHVHIGIAVAVDDGLVVPTLRFTDSLSLSQISSGVKELAGKAKDKKLQPQEMEGSTFTISNLGMFGIEEFTAIVNPPSTCILAVGGIKQTPIVKDGQIVPGNIMKVTLSCDHRAVDGAVGASFLKTFKELLEDPIRLLV